MKLINARRSVSLSRSHDFDLVVAGTVAGLAQLTVACPVDAVKVILQSQIEKEGRVPHVKGKANYIFTALAALTTVITVRKRKALYIYKWFSRSTDTGSNLSKVNSPLGPLYMRPEISDIFVN